MAAKKMTDMRQAIISRVQLEPQNIDWDCKTACCSAEDNGLDFPV